jgi:alkylation response protein AidB-like acyl-CoA dehydrogenase
MLLTKSAVYFSHHPASSHALFSELRSFGERVLRPDIFEWIRSAETYSPSVSTHSTFGVPKTVLHTSDGWNNLQALGIREGIVAIPYESPLGYLARRKQFLKYHLWSGSCAVVTCPSAMADGAARLLSKHVGKYDDTRNEVFQDAYRRLTSRDPAVAWTSGQWMTERSGGSDVRGTETLATYIGTDEHPGLDEIGLPLGPWSISGFKWFSSATDSQMAILLAQTPSGKLSALYAPMQRRSPSGEIEFNGVTIQRLKRKLGTRALPKAELVLDDMRAYLIGNEGEGLREIAANLNITRIHTALSAMGFWGRGLAISRAYAKVRRVDGGRLLRDVPAHVTGIAKTTVNYAAHMQLAFFTGLLLGISEHPDDFNREASSAYKEQMDISSPTQVTALLRLLTPVIKAQCSLNAVHGLRECMENLGGIGYLENEEQEFNLARLFRDACVLSIWEGTTDVLAADVVRVLKGKEGSGTLKAMEGWVHDRLRAWGDEWREGGEGLAKWVDVLVYYCGKRGNEELKLHGRALLEGLAWVFFFRPPCRRCSPRWR